MRIRTRAILLVSAIFIYGLADSSEADDVWIYMYAHEASTPVRVLEVTSETDAFGQCEFFRDLLDKSLGDAHESVFFTCVVPADLEKGIQL